MTKRQTPPGRMSKLDVVVENPLGPHHCARCFGSVQASNTSVRGASMMRVVTMDRAASAISLSAPTFLLLFFFGLQLPDIVLEAVEPLFPDFAIPLEPGIGLLERARLDAAWPPLRILAARDETGRLQHLQML